MGDVSEPFLTGTELESFIEIERNEYTTSEVADMLKETPQMIRHYCQTHEKYLRIRRKNNKSHRRFSKENIALLYHIIQCYRKGYTKEEIDLMLDKMLPEYAKNSDIETVNFEGENEDIEHNNTALQVMQENSYLLHRIMHGQEQNKELFIESHKQQMLEYKELMAMNRNLSERMEKLSGENAQLRIQTNALIREKEILLETNEKQEVKLQEMMKINDENNKSLNTLLEYTANIMIAMEEVGGKIDVHNKRWFHKIFKKQEKAK